MGSDVIQQLYDNTIKLVAKVATEDRSKERQR